MPVMFDYDRQLHRIALHHKGLVTLELSRADGIPDEVIDRRVAAGVLIPMHDGVYRHAAVPFTQDLRDLAAVLSCGSDAVLSHRAAARLHGFPRVRRAKPEVTSPHTDLPLVDGVDVHRTTRLQVVERTLVRGIPVTTPGRTALDYCAVTPLWLAKEVIVEAVVMKIVRPEDILATLERSAGRGKGGSVALREVASELGDLASLESVLELLVARIIDPLPIPTPVRQFPLTCADGREVRLDFAWPDVRFALEPNGRRWHDTPRRKRQTEARQASIRATGWTHEHCGWAEVHDEPRQLARVTLDTYLACRAAAAA